jgi:hypothetical protein
MEIITQTKKELQSVLTEVLKASKSEDKRQNSDVKRLSLALRNFLSDEKNQHELKVGVNMEGIRKIVYNLANYDASKSKSPSFETRTTRAIKDALLTHFKVGVNLKSELATTDDKDIDSYIVRTDNDDLAIPHNVLEPMIKKEIKGVKQDVPNTSTDLIPLSSKMVETMFNEAFPTMSRKIKQTLKEPNNIETLITTTNDYLKNLLSNDKIKLDDLLFTPSKIKGKDILEELEHNINLVITKRTELEQQKKKAS